MSDKEKHHYLSHINFYKLRGHQTASLTVDNSLNEIKFEAKRLQILEEEQEKKDGMMRLLAQLVRENPSFIGKQKTSG